MRRVLQWGVLVCVAGMLAACVDSPGSRFDSGGVEIKAGVYFHWLEPVPNKGSVTLAGYVRIHGELSAWCPMWTMSMSYRAR